MKILKPELDEINLKFKDNAMKRQQEMMSLYQKQVQVNEWLSSRTNANSCFFALFLFFPSAFDLRQKSFLWADDLSTYDSIFDLVLYTILW